jgi:hypothetical protein
MGQSTGVIHCVFDQILNLLNCFTTPNKNLGREGTSDRETLASKSLFQVKFKKSRHLGLESISICSMKSLYPSLPFVYMFRRDNSAIGWSSEVSRTTFKLDEGTIKTPIPKCCLYWCFVWGGVAILWVLNLVRNTVLNSCRIWSTTQLNTPPQPHTIFI